MFIELCVDCAMRFALACVWPCVCICVLKCVLSFVLLCARICDLHCALLQVFICCCWCVISFISACYRFWDLSCLSAVGVSICFICFMCVCGWFLLPADSLLLICHMSSDLLVAMLFGFEHLSNQPANCSLFSPSTCFSMFPVFLFDCLHIFQMCVLFTCFLCVSHHSCLLAVAVSYLSCMPHPVGLSHVSCLPAVWVSYLYVLPADGFSYVPPVC